MRLSLSKYPASISLLFLATAGCFCSCNRAGSSQVASADTAAFWQYLEKGNDAYSEKKGYASFANSLRYFDTAQSIADASGDTMLLAEAVFAKGRVYDAWNKEPRKTIQLFKDATALFKTQPAAQQRYLYAKHLVAHAFDKVQDSTGATYVLSELFAELRDKDTATLHRLPFTAEMALIATEVHDYALADSILRYLTRREWIGNDSNTYDYLNHYYLTQSRLDAFWRRPAHSVYLDSLQNVYSSAANIFDRTYYAHDLAILYAATHDYEKAYRFKSKEQILNDSLNNRLDLMKMQQALAQSELIAERHKLEYEHDMRRTRIWAIWILSLFLAVITVLSIYLHRRNKGYRTQSARLSAANDALDKEVEHVALLNKEIQHRVKNNLHMIYSLLEMQERKTDNEETVTALQDARLRVESIAALHNHMLSAGGSVDFTSFIKTLIASVVKCLSDEKKIITHLSTEPIFLPVNSYFALSLILNEWVTNSVKYAATDSNMIEINVSIINEPEQVCIEYSDSGRISASNAMGGLGTQIVSLLTRQLRATLNNLNNNPYYYQLCIPHGAKD